MSTLQVLRINVFRSAFVLPPKVPFRGSVRILRNFAKISQNVRHALQKLVVQKTGETTLVVQKTLQL